MASDLACTTGYEDVQWLSFVRVVTNQTKQLLGC
jgi:hypothetical protein